MLLSADRQREFAAALLDPERPTPSGIIGPDGDVCPKRFAVYRNNVVMGLTEILKAAYPVARRLVGEEFFDAMAGIYVRAEPPRSPILSSTGGPFLPSSRRSPQPQACPIWPMWRASNGLGS